MTKGVALKNAAPFFCPKSILGTVWEQNLPSSLFLPSRSFCFFHHSHSLRVGSRLSACTNRMTTVSHHQNLFEILWSDGCLGVLNLSILTCESSHSESLKIYFPYENFVKGGTAPLFLPNTMKIKLLIIHPALKLGVKPGLRAISSKIECACERECEWDCGCKYERDSKGLLC